jgi:hypothetical protein
MKSGSALEFISMWDDARSTPNLSSKDFRGSGLGNINIGGSSTCTRVTIFTKRDPQFESSIEDGVKKLVFKLIEILWSLQLL